MIAAAWSLTVLFSGTARAQNQTNTLMLVRAWNPHTGLLTGWLPTHRLAMSFRLIGRPSKPAFNANEGVTITWSRWKNGTGSGRLRISPVPREFDGKQWLPLLRDANVVRIKHRLFLIDQIIFEGGNYSRPTRVSQDVSCFGPGTSKAFTDGCR